MKLTREGSDPFIAGEVTIAIVSTTLAAAGTTR
jgi:hypothetical protein